MGDEDGDAILGELAEVLENFCLSGCIHGGRGFIQHQDVGFGAHESAGQGDFLPLATGEFLAVLEPLAELGFVTGRQAFDER